MNLGVIFGNFFCLAFSFQAVRFVHCASYWRKTPHSRVNYSISSGVSDGSRSRFVGFSCGNYEGTGHLWKLWVWLSKFPSSFFNFYVVFEVEIEICSWKTVVEADSWVLNVLAPCADLNCFCVLYLNLIVYSVTSGACWLLSHSCYKILIYWRLSRI